jgi:hypothetical protein
VLAVIVVSRTLLSFALELEVSGRWPWQRAEAADRQVRAVGKPEAQSTTDEVVIRIRPERCFSRDFAKAS